MDSFGDSEDIDLYRYIMETPEGSRAYVFSAEHMLYPWEAAEALGIDEKDLKKELACVCRGKPKYFYTTRKGTSLRCYSVSEIMEAVESVRKK